MAKYTKSTLRSKNEFANKEKFKSTKATKRKNKRTQNKYNGEANNVENIYDKDVIGFEMNDTDLGTTPNFMSDQNDINYYGQSAQTHMNYGSSTMYGQTAGFDPKLTKTNAAANGISEESAYAAQKQSHLIKQESFETLMKPARRLKRKAHKEKVAETPEEREKRIEEEFFNIQKLLDQGQITPDEAQNRFNALYDEDSEGEGGGGGGAEIGSVGDKAESPVYSPRSNEENLENSPQFLKKDSEQIAKDNEKNVVL